MAARYASPKQTMSRRLLLAIGSLALLIPFLRFVTHRIPRKPIIVKVTDPLKQNGYLAKDTFLIFSREDQLWAVSRSCTHLGCKLHYKETEDLLECPCHQSRFSIQGAVINGPAKKELKRFTVEKSGDPPAFLVST